MILNETHTTYDCRSADCGASVTVLVGDDDPDPPLSDQIERELCGRCYLNLETEDI